MSKVKLALLSALLLLPSSSAMAGSSKSSRPKPAKECQYRTPVHLHEVLPGEHLGLIAGRYGVYRKDLIALNAELENPDRILPGQMIQVCPEIPPREQKTVTHVVAAGENLASIAKRYELEVEALLEMQGGRVSNPNHIRVGQELTIELEGDILPGFDPEEVEEKNGRLSRSVQLREGDGYMLKRPHLAFGTPATISTIERVLTRYRKRSHGGPVIHVGDISKQSGGPLSGHLSHQTGKDVDIGLVHRGPAASSVRFVKATDGNLDVERTWMLVEEFLQTGNVRYIFLDYEVQKQLYDYARGHGVSKRQLDEWFQYPRGRGRGFGIVRHWRNHADHIHVRFRG